MDSLRGVAACGVMLYHYTLYGSLFDRSTPTFRAIASVTQYGNLGVPVFFVISGFVLPHSLAASGYRLADAPKFVLRRLVRLEPVYLLSIALTLGLWKAATMTDAFRGPPFRIDASQFFSHFAYLAEVTGHEWYVRNYWTLGMEFQFYLSIALLFPAMNSHGAWLRGLLTAALVAADLADLPAPIFTAWGSLFALGVVTYFARDPVRRRWSDFAVAAACLVSLWLHRGPAMSIAAGATAAVIWTDRFPQGRPLLWLGSISYSLYLFHGIVGQKVVNLAGRWADGDLARIVWLVVAVAATLVFSWLAYVAVERPSQRVASRIRYRASAGP